MSLKITIPDNEKRTVEQLKEHYAIEKELAKQLISATKENRKHLYTALYDELYTKVTHHPRWTRQSSPEIRDWIVAKRMELLERFLAPDVTFLEIGPGDCSLSVAVSKHVKQVYAADVATEVTKDKVFPENFQFMVSDGCNINVPENTVNVAYSHQLMEHLHPDDAIDQLQSIYKTLAPKGRYICITPNRLSGPHDISRYFEESAQGFHLKEYTVSELYEQFRKAGFSEVTWVKNNGKVHLEIPLNPGIIALIKGVEKSLESMSYGLRRKIANTPLLFRGMTIIGTK